MSTNGQNIDTLKEATSFFNLQGYFIARSLISQKKCDALINSFLKEIKTFEGNLLRVTTAKPEPHYISDEGLMVNPILDIQNVDTVQFPGFHQTTLKLLADSGLQSLASSFLDDTPILIQSGYFESSLGSVPHIDSYFFDSENQSLIACWIALEDIKPDAGRFIIYPCSHLLGQQGVFEDEIHDMFRQYETMTLEIIQCSQIDKKTPDLLKLKKSRKLLNDIISSANLFPLKTELKAGDVVFFSSKTIHGSDMPTSTSSTISRNSLIGHFTPLGQKLIRYGTLEEKLNPYSSNGLLIQSPIVR